MSPTRPADWTALGYSADPIPGDPDAVTNAAQGYATIAEAIRTAQSSLNSISYQGRGKGVAKLQEQCRTVSGHVGQAYTRCSDASTTLRTYAGSLRAAQATSLEALREANASKGEADRLLRCSIQTAESYNRSTDPVERAGLRAQWYRQRDDLASSNGAVSAARAKLSKAIAERNRAAGVAASELTEIKKNSPLNDTFWDRVKEFLDNVAAVLEKIKPVLEAFSTALAVASFVAAVLCPPFGFAVTVLAVASAAVAVATAACSVIINASKCANGQMSVGEMLLRSGVDVLVAAASVYGARSALKAAGPAADAARGIKSGANKAGLSSGDAALASELRDARGVERGFLTYNAAIDEGKDDFGRGAVGLAERIGLKPAEGTITRSFINEVGRQGFEDGADYVRESTVDRMTGHTPKPVYESMLIYKVGTIGQTLHPGSTQEADVSGRSGGGS